MKAFCIIIDGHAQSEAVGARCIASAAAVGLTMEKFPAITPANDPMAMFAARGWPTEKFTGNRFSRPLPCMACFLSHAELWHRCAFSGETFIIAEHDCVFRHPLPGFIHDSAWLVNLAKPSFGTFKQPQCGVGPLVSKPHMPGLTCYLVRPQGARELLRQVPAFAEPADVYVHTNRFKWLRELYPWIAFCDDSFSTVQAELGCRGKHNKVAIV